MLYSIASANNVSVIKMHNYLKLHTGSDGKNYPELFNDIAKSESINGLYTFAIACVIYDDLKEIDKLTKKYPTTETAILSFTQYIKGLATTVQLNNKCVNPLYEGMKENGTLGRCPTLLNLDGDLFTHHYDTNKYSSKDEANKAEDSFPYWVLKVVKDINQSDELITPKKNIKYELPYYVQNISLKPIPIYTSPIKEIAEVIGDIPPTGVEPIEKINVGYGKLMTTVNGYVKLNDTEIIPVKMLEDDDELFTRTKFKERIKVPEDYVVKAPFTALRGITDHYYGDGAINLNIGDGIHITKIFRKNYGVIEKGTVQYYIPLSPDILQTKNEYEKILKEKNEKQKSSSDHSKKESKVAFGFEPDKKYVVYLTPKSESQVKKMKSLIDTRTDIRVEYSNFNYDGTSGFYLLHEYDNERDAIDAKKTIMKRTGYKVFIGNKDEL